MTMDAAPLSALPRTWPTATPVAVSATRARKPCAGWDAMAAEAAAGFGAGTGADAGLAAGADDDLADVDADLEEALDCAAGCFLAILKSHLHFNCFE